LNAIGEELESADKIKNPLHFFGTVDSIDPSKLADQQKPEEENRT